MDGGATSVAAMDLNDLVCFTYRLVSDLATAIYFHECDWEWEQCGYLSNLTLG